MAKLTVTYTDNRIDINFNDYFAGGFVDTDCISIKRGQFYSSTKENDYLVVKLLDSQKWRLSNVSDLESEEILKVDTINGIAPTSLQHLQDLIKEIII